MTFLGPTSSTVITFNSSAFIDYHYQEFLDYPLRLSLRFRTLGRISNGVLLSLTHRKSSSLITPFIIIEHSNGKIEITILQLDERKVLSTVTVSRPPEKKTVVLRKEKLIAMCSSIFLIFKHFRRRDNVNLFSH
jgi:hypothetical protein